MKPELSSSSEANFSPAPLGELEQWLINDRKIPENRASYIVDGVQNYLNLVCRDDNQLRLELTLPSDEALSQVVAYLHTTMVMNEQSWPRLKNNATVTKDARTLLTAREAAVKIGTSYSNFRNWVSQRRIRPVDRKPFPLYDPDDVERLRQLQELDPLRPGPKTSPKN